MIEDRRDLLGGALLVIGGVAVALHAQEHHALGTFRRMGPGMFPFGAGLIMALLGALIAIPALFRRVRRGPDAIPARPFILIMLSIVAFALTMPRLGLAPAITVLVALSSLADRGFKPLNAAAVAVVMSVASYLIFVAGLNLPLPLFRWPL